jgi:hypothetical protein
MRRHLAHQSNPDPVHLVRGKHSSRLAMLLILLASVVTRGESRPLQFVKQIGSGWLSEKPGWMSFVSFSPDGTMVASDGAGSTTVAARQRGSVVRKAALRSQDR